ncbi:response regulator, partial [Serratia proteamaculans]|uniref:response regulator n=1 Tax=Serratia proteamaculans TaxID=28151 RepID=UPI003D036B67
MKLLIVEDQPKTGHYLRQGLSEAGFCVELVADGTTGQHLALSGDYALLILDVMLPGRNGWQILQAVRGAGLEMPVLFLTARDAVEDRVHGLELGADDYLVKPCITICGIGGIQIISTADPGDLRMSDDM